ncbi:smr domain-containing protein [Nannizzia gypsea CBS 118893]|uniref:Smr domain-containing protein n=1 Tax=Arthroderma gypseum (strain ATCC MYA-4604 / CBS 118893) TaxID=535722 RepID=E4USF1_ARTGP|nr:smr domain-containing protein [Nannizzia gypsea CBS 118893]EFR00518.1 smr domain-containing protein [Nannizzia gypsea CBS 118893]
MSASFIGARAFNHEQHSDTEEEYDRLRGLARHEAELRGSCFDRSRQAYENGDGQRAKELSEEGKEHGRKMEQYNKQASEFIFRENNAEGRVAADTIDLHGQFVEEAEDILEERIKYARQHGQDHLHVIVGKGNHSVNHVQKIKPRVEQVCRDLGLQYATEENAGRIYVNLTGGPANMPPHSSHPNQGHNQPHHGQPQHGQPQHGQPHYGQQHHGQPHGQPQHQPGHQEETPAEKIARKALPIILRKLEKACCIVM